MHTLYAIDLTTTPGGVSEAPEGLPPGGFASPLGYWFAADGWDESRPCGWHVLPAGLGLATDIGRRARHRRRRGSSPPLAEGRDPARRAQAGSSPPRGRLDVQVGRGSAQVIAAHADWSDPDTAEAVILAVAQCWRLQALEHALDELTARARGDLGSGGASRPRRLVAATSRGPRARLRAAGAGARPARLRRAPDRPARLPVEARRSARLFRALTRRLGLHDWRNLIDERVEALRGGAAAEVEALRHAELFTCEIALEALILAALIADIAFHAAMTLFWG